MFVGAVNRNKSEICLKRREHQAQYDYPCIVIQIVKIIVVERGTVLYSDKEFERHCLRA